MPDTHTDDRDLATTGADEPADRGNGIGEQTLATEPLFSDEAGERYRANWRRIQTEFVDRPREAVQEADRLVADLMQYLAAQFTQARVELERQWNENEDVSTEDLRVALTRYRSFFERLLSA